VLSTGVINIIKADGKKLAYVRFNDTERIIVCFNLEKTKQDFQVDVPGNYTDLLTSKKYSRINTISLQPFTAVILKKIK
jgi:hypothetical protein